MRELDNALGLPDQPPSGRVGLAPALAAESLQALGDVPEQPAALLEAALEQLKIRLFSQRFTLLFPQSVPPAARSAADREIGAA